MGNVVILRTALEDKCPVLSLGHRMTPLTSGKDHPGITSTWGRALSPGLYSGEERLPINQEKEK